MPWHLLCWTNYLATATGRMSQSSCVHGQKNGTSNLMFLHGHPQISEVSLPFDTAQVQVQNPTPRYCKPSMSYLLLLKAAARHLVPLEGLCHPFTWVLESTSTTWSTVVSTEPKSSAQGHDWSIHKSLQSDKYQSSSTELLHRVCLLVLQLSVSKKTKKTELCCFSQEVIL